ncbi:MAG: hypothetical protein AB1374_06755 [Bacillota bacterium]
MKEQSRLSDNGWQRETLAVQQGVKLFAGIVDKTRECNTIATMIDVCHESGITRKLKTYNIER